MVGQSNNTSSGDFKMLAKLVYSYTKNNNRADGNVVFSIQTTNEHGQIVQNRYFKMNSQAFEKALGRMNYVFDFLHASKSGKSWTITVPMSK